MPVHTTKKHLDRTPSVPLLPCTTSPLPGREEGHKSIQTVKVIVYFQSVTSYVSIHFSEDKRYGTGTVSGGELAP